MAASARPALGSFLLLFVVHPSLAKSPADHPLPRIDQRFANRKIDETPDFQRHIVPLLGRLGCNGRACHGSFQGQGGFRLSLFGYDFEADHKALIEGDEPRVAVNDPVASLILNKPTSEDDHEGGQRYERDGWEYRALRNWIEGGAKFDGEHVAQLQRLDITPAEIVFDKPKQTEELQVVAVWADGTREDVTPLCRFRSNDEQVAQIDTEGRITAGTAGDTHVVVFYDNGVVPVPVLQPVSDLVGPNYPDVPVPTEIDRLVIAKLKKLGVVPSELADDATFLRRASLDITGTLPTRIEVEEFLADRAKNKRAKKIDQLLETPAYAAWWSTRLCDFTGNNEQQLNNASPMRNSAGREWYDWVYKRVEQNAPYDELVEGMLTATSRDADQSYTEFCEQMSDLYRSDDKEYADLPDMTYYWARRDFREVEARAIGVAYSFMGLRIQCAQCHKHPFDQWSTDDFHQFKNFFARVTASRNGGTKESREEYNTMVKKLGIQGKRGGDLRRMLPQLLESGKTIPFPEVFVADKPRRRRNSEYPEFEHAKLLGGDVVEIEGAGDPRTALMDWLRSKDNPYFARAFVNRVWAAYFGVGIVDPPDDLSLANAPSNAPLLDYLAQGFIDSGFDMKWVHRTIARSRTYQLSWKPNETNRRDTKNFSRAVPRRLPAEVAYDAVTQAAASDERIAEMQRDLDGRAIAIASSSRRTNGRGPSYALAVFGRSTRENNCDCDRSSEPSLLQTVFLQNDREVLESIGRDRGSWLGQIADRIEPDRKAKSDYASQLARFNKKLKVTHAQFVSAKKRKAKDEIRRHEARRVEVNKQIAKLRKAHAAEAEQPSIAKDQAAAIVHDAYLRTLSRRPSQEETDRSVRHIQEAADPLDGARDVLWALINTKEFIVNH